MEASQSSSLMETNSSSADVLSFCDKDSIASAVKTILRNNGMTTATNDIIINNSSQSVPKKTNRSGCSTRVFGLPLEGAVGERKMTESDGRPCYIPRFFVESVEFLRKNVKTEGLFRKAGSLSRQKILRAKIEEGSYILGSSNPHDVAALLKQYLRELPEPLVTKKLAPLLLECTTLFNNEDTASSTDNNLLSISQGILMISLLLPTQHLICLKILMKLLNEVTIHRKESLMDSKGLAVVIAPNIFPQQTFDDKRNKKGGGRSTVDAKLGVKDMTGIVSTLIDHAHLIGRVPPMVEQLSQEIHQTEIETNYCKKKKKHKRHETVSLLLRETFSKIKGGQKKQDSPSGTMSSDDLLDSPDGLGPGSSKRVALNESSDYSSDNKSASVTPSPLSTGIKKKLFTRKTKRQYSILRGKGEGGGKFEKVPLLSCQQQSQEDLFPGIPSSPLLQTHTSSCDLLSLPNNVSIPPHTVTHVSFPSTTYTSTTVQASPLTVEPSTATISTSSNYKLVSKTRKTYHRHRPVIGATTSTATPGISRHKPVAVPSTNNFSSRIPLKTDHCVMRKRKASELPRSRSALGHNDKLKMTSLPVSHSEFTLSTTNCPPSHVTASTPIRERPKRKATTSGHRRLTQPQFNTDIKQPSTVNNKMSDPLETVANNDSYLYAVDDSLCKLTPFRKVLYEIGNETSLQTPVSKSATAITATTSQRRTRSKSMRAVSNHATTATATATVTPRQTPGAIDRSGKSSIMKSQSMSRRGITTARSPWINRRGIQISEWDI